MLKRILIILLIILAVLVAIYFSKNRSILKAPGTFEKATGVPLGMPPAPKKKSTKIKFAEKAQKRIIDEEGKVEDTIVDVNYA